MNSENKKTPTNVEVKIYREKSLVKELDLSRSTIRRMVKTGDFPKPISLGKRAIGWRREDIEEWVRSRKPA